MSKKLSMENLAEYITDNVKKIAAVRREAEEIQVGFNSAYVEWKAQHDAALERLVESVTARLEEVGPDLRARVEERIPEEHRVIAERRQQLREGLIPTTQTEADLILRQGQELTDKLRQLNPRLDQREEELKAQGASLEKELNQLNGQIRSLSGCLGVVLHFFKINKLDRQRQQVIGQLKVVQQELKKVRDEWRESQQQIKAEREALQAQWQERTLKLAQLQGELDYLDAEANRQALALKRAARHVIDYLKEPIPCPAGDVKAELDAMVELNIQTDDYEEGLGSVSGLLALLDGVTEGLTRFNESVNGLINEQRMHSSYLSKPHITAPDDVLAFHEQWDGLAKKVQDDGRLCARPTEFLDTVRPILERDLSEARIRATFESMGQALKDATSDWRG